MHQVSCHSEWFGDSATVAFGETAIRQAVHQIQRPVFLLNCDGQLGVSHHGTAVWGDAPHSSWRLPAQRRPLLAHIPPLHPGQLGSPGFRDMFGLQYAYVVGAMANGITSIDMVKAAGQAGMIGFFGAAGLPLDQLESAIGRLKSDLTGCPYGVNLIHSPAEPQLEASTVDLYLKHGVSLVSASAYLDLTLPLVYFRLKDIYRDSAGHIICPNRIMAKASRVEVARKFLSPPPAKLINQLVHMGHLTEQQAEWAKSVPVADTLTAEADSGGHTDNRPAISLLPTMLALRNAVVEKYAYAQPLYIGLGGGIATPDSAAAAFCLGADYILTGSINQACTEAGTSDIVRRMLCEADQADVTMAPAADMFEMGVKVQVLKRGTMFPFRAMKLYDLYNRSTALEDLAPADIQMLERDYFRQSLDAVWQQTERYFQKRDPAQIQRAQKDARHKMALVFRSYLGQSSNWANQGEASRQIDYQIWCGPAIGAFNAWVRGTFLEQPQYRQTVTLAMNILYGAAVVSRFNWLQRQYGHFSNRILKIEPQPLEDILDLLIDTREDLRS